MGTRGRVSAASLEVAQPGGVERVQRPDAPYDLTDEQAEVWWRVVNRLPADWFPAETHGLLSDYCRHEVKSRRISQLVAAAESDDPLDIDMLDKLYKMAERESRAASSLATRLRITQQATVSPKAKKPGQAKRPWE
ncbi:hypothetical protein [Pseudogemmobacter sonorensis]|uniref:hypothetical protein n=1 Tax=Pseudogemmobacter sonorensis TaxID=2989681 RepID=UPI0036AAA9F7